MSHRRWIYATRAAAALGIAAFALFTLAAPENARFSGFFNTWVYIGLMVLACAIAGSYVYLVKRERAAWVAITLALVFWTFGELWYAVFTPDTYPSMADAGWKPEDVQFVFFATLSPDLYFPGNGVLLQHQLGLGEVGAMDIRNQCTGFVYGLSAADGYIRRHPPRSGDVHDFGSALPEFVAAFEPARLGDTATRDLMQAIEVALDSGLDAAFPRQRAARVAITTRGGESEQLLQPTRIGDPDAPLSDARLEDKYRELAIPVIGEVQAEALLQRLWRLEEAPSLKG